MPTPVIVLKLLEVLASQKGIYYNITYTDEAERLRNLSWRAVIKKTKMKFL